MPVGKGRGEKMNELLFSISRILISQMVVFMEDFNILAYSMQNSPIKITCMTCGSSI